MKALSLLQPWASLIMVGAKKWETRSWRPSKETLYRLRNTRLLIHASAKYDKQNKGLLTFPPFCGFLNYADNLPTGAIIGSVVIGRVISTIDWIAEFNPAKNNDAAVEKAFGNYNGGRWAWELLSVRKFEYPIPAKGSLSLWEYNEGIPYGDPIVKPEGFL